VIDPFTLCGTAVAPQPLARPAPAGIRRNAW